MSLKDSMRRRTFSPWVKVHGDILDIEDSITELLESERFYMSLGRFRQRMKKLRGDLAGLAKAYERELREARKSNR